MDLACKKGASNWLTVIPLKDMDFDLNNREFRDAVRLRHDWPRPDNPSVCVCGSMFTVNHAMICQRGDLSPKQIYGIHENEKKRKYNSRVTEIEQATFTPLAFTTTGWMADECLRYHSRLAEQLSAKKQESYATTISWVRAKVSFAILRSALLCLRGWRTPARRKLDVKDRDLEIGKGQAGLP